MDELHTERLQGYNPEDEYASVDALPEVPLTIQTPAAVPEAMPEVTPEAAPNAAPNAAHSQHYPPFREPSVGGDGIPDYTPRQYAPHSAPVEPESAPVQSAPAPQSTPVQVAPAQVAPVQVSPVQQPVQRPVYPANPYTPAGVPTGAPTQQPYYPQQPYRPNPPYPAQGYPQPQGNYMPYYPPYQQEKKEKLSGGTIAFIAILSLVLVISLITFGCYIVVNSLNDPNTSFEQPAPDSPDDGNNGFDYFFGMPNAVSGNEFSEEITLVADNGETQQRDTDNEDNIFVPERDSAGIALKSLPKDKDSDKYNARSAYDSVCDSVVSVMCYVDEITEDMSTLAGQGTGTIISADGYIITNAHVIGNSRSYLIEIMLNNEQKYRAKIVGYDTWTDLALLKIDAKDLRAVTFGDSELIEIGQDVIAIGNPGGTAFKNSLTKGIVSAVGRELTINKNVEYIQSDAAINPGNSGGPLCNIYGQVIGINSVKISSEVYEGMTFSIPSVTVKEIVDDLMRYGYVSGRPRIGLSGYEVSEEDIYYGYPQGVLVDSIDENGSLAGTDIRQGDIITAIDGTPISSFQDIYDILSNHKAGDKVKLTVYRPND